MERTRQLPSPLQPVAGSPPQHSVPHSLLHYSSSGAGLHLRRSSSYCSVTGSYSSSSLEQLSRMSSSSSSSSPFSSTLVGSCRSAFCPPSGSSVSDVELAHALEDRRTSILLVDLRSFMTFKRSHLKQSINVSLAGALAKRRTLSLATVEANISHGDERLRFQERAGREIVVYDSASTSLDENSLLKMIVIKLGEEGAALSVHWLKGGYERFVKHFPQYTLADERCQVTPLQFNNSQAAKSMTAEALQDWGSLSQAHLAEPVRVLEYLYLGDAQIASNMAMLRQYNIRYILNMAQEVPNYFENSTTGGSSSSSSSGVGAPTVSGSAPFVYRKIPLYDNPSQQCLLSTFQAAFDFIDEAQRNSERVLVHCLAGRSRSVTIVMGYLMYKLGMQVNEAYQYLQKIRPSICPNLGFMGVLTNLCTRLPPAAMSSVPQHPQQRQPSSSSCFFAAKLANPLLMRTLSNVDSESAGSSPVDSPRADDSDESPSPPPLVAATTRTSDYLPAKPRRGYSGCGADLLETSALRLDSPDPSSFSAATLSS